MAASFRRAAELSADTGAAPWLTDAPAAESAMASLGALDPDLEAEAAALGFACGAAGIGRAADEAETDTSEVLC